MNVHEVIRRRRSIRKYKSREVEREKLDRVLEAGRLSPSAANRQPWHFIVVTDPKVRESLRAAYNRDWFVGAPAIIVACADPKGAWVRADGQEYWGVDVAIALQSMVLAATEEGLGTCWIAAFDEKAAVEALKIPPGIRVVAMTPLGYPDEEKGEVTNRKAMGEILHWNVW
ncbi:MAG: nitroreductase family protein [bacterium]